MKNGGYFLVILFLVFASCTSNTIYKKPENLIPKDSMIALLTDMYIASSAKNQKNKFLKREKNYVVLVYEKYKIDSTRFDVSNSYYTSKIEDYTDMLKSVKKNIDSLYDTYEEEYLVQDSITKSKRNEIVDDEEFSSEEDLSKKLSEKNSKFTKLKKELVE